LEIQKKIPEIQSKQKLFLSPRKLKNLGKEIQINQNKKNFPDKTSKFKQNPVTQTKILIFFLFVFLDICQK
jgi:hypothetical protein